MTWQNKYWSTFGGIFALGIIARTLFIYRSETLLNAEALLWLHLAILMLHQFEEYSYPGGFKDFYNSKIYNKNPIMRFPLNNLGIFVVNVAIAWTVYAYAALNTEEAILLSLGLFGVTFINGVLHTLMFVILRIYNPGLITGFFLFIPFGFYGITKLTKYIADEGVVTAIIVFIIGIALIPFSIWLTSTIKESKTT